MAELGQPSGAPILTPNGHAAAVRELAGRRSNRGKTAVIRSTDRLSYLWLAGAIAAGDATAAAKEVA
jgi:hypothetical protein